MISEHTDQPTILLVDDALEELKALIVFLEKSGFRIVIAESGKAALDRLAFTLPDIILLDVLMPGMDGFETCRRLKENTATRDIPVIFLTALSETVDKVKGFDAGGVDYIAKPVHHEEVLARINAHLTNHKLQQQLQEEKARFQALSEATFEGIFIHDESCILEINQTLEKMFGYHRSEALGRDVLEFVRPEFHQAVLEHIQMKDETPYQAEGIRKDGTSFPVEVQAKMMPYQGREVRIVAVRDLSWQRAVEKERNHLRKERNHLRKENIALKANMKNRYRFGEIIGKSPTMQDVYQSIVNASASDANVLVCGESGTGKELVARTIHQLSERKEQAFVAVNCGAVPEALFEREFFGHRKGAFTGADRDKPGYFDQVHGGTLFLDEISELSPTMQVKLLRVLQDGEYTPLGDTTSKTADVRIIAATNKDLKEQLRQELIREDFFYRIRVIVINLPPLRDRKEDIPLLTEHFLEQYAGGKEPPTIPARIIEILCSYHWPGNVRELQNELQRYLAEQRFEFIGDVPPESPARDRSESLELNLEGTPLREAVEALEKSMIARVLAQNSGHKGKTAKMLGLSPRTLYERIKKYRLDEYRYES